MGEQESPAKKMLTLRTEELILKTHELKQTSNYLLASNNALKLNTEELAKTHADLFESSHQLASVNKELSATNKKFAETNVRFAQVNEELSEANKELGRVNKELALANERIKAQEESNRDFINIAAHEFRTPTQSIMGFSELLQNLFEEEKAIRGDDHNSDSKEHDNQNQKKMALDAVVRNASRLERLAKDILDVAKIESNSLTLNKERFSLTEKISNTISDIIATQIRKDGINDDNKNIKINFESKGGERGNGIFIEADKTMIQQVISNLLKNAIKFAKEGGTITITADISTPKKVEAEGRGKSEGKEGGGEVVVVEVKDTGSGIDASILPRLFIKFATSSSEGIGLGLYISKGIVEAHGGRIWAENNLDGKGATVAFILPCLVN
ncbi:MAG: ATP-binding protein [Nitrososphaeraceae archaeon]